MPKEESLPSRKKMRKGTHSCFECRRRKIRCIYQPVATADERYTVENKHDDNIVDCNTIAHSVKREKAKQALIAMLPPHDQLSKLLNTNSDWWQTWRRKCSGTSGPEQTLPQFAAQALTTGNVGAIGTVVLSVGICSSDDSDDVERYIETVDKWVLSDDEYAASLEGMECLILKSKWYADVGQPRRAWIAYRKGLMYAQLMGLHRKRTSSLPHESIWWALYHGDRFLSLLLGLPYGISDSHCDLTMPEIGDSQYIHPLIVIIKLSQLAGRVIDRNQGVAEQSFAWALQLDQELEDLWKKLDPAWLDYSELLAEAESNAAELRERLMGQMVFHQIRVYLHLPFMLKSASNSRFSYSRTACLNGSREVLRLYQALRTGHVQPLYECKAIDFIGFTAAVLIQIGLLNFGMNDQSSATPKDVEEDVRLIEISIDIFRRASSEKGGKVAAQSAQVLENMMGKFKGTSNALDDSCGAQSNFVIPYFGTISIKRGGQTVTKGPPPPGAMSSSISSSRSPATSSQPFTPPSDKQSKLWSHPTQSTQSINVTPKPSISAGTGTTTLNFTEPSPFVSYDGVYNWNILNADDASTSATGGINTQINDDSMNNFPLPTNNFSWQHMPMDIDQDWSWFLNDAQTTQGMAPVPTVPLDGFNVQGFTGFG
ncbi:hypothetical protein EJ02DRAFT_44676 [Clathrospora elynae]|uniref:Xylanolytic transcriptional activator regulatory domain-containing protein n=1 Tax=Clathrospora elynae TaxID=706981 RepID=A0A6A5T1C4_9PLEO|nr:hypothetical protein EJ02DRAFT_44676 [Clathrospora elynae]